MKRIVICMDGTWQRLSTQDATNIAIIARSVAHHQPKEDGSKIQQIVIYSRGVGAFNELNDRAGMIFGALFGAGLEESLLDTYLRLVFNYEPGDEIYIFGYSRGAFSARSLAGLIAKCGIVSRRHAERAAEAFKLYQDRQLSSDDEKVVKFREETGKRLRFAGADGSFFRTSIRYMGIFDTVGQRGMPSVLGPISDLINRRFLFHDLALHPATQAARHALALDETRWLFPHTPWSNLDHLNDAARKDAALRGDHFGDEPYQQRWFPGGHGDIGGGGGAVMSAHALQWIVTGAEACGLLFDRATGSKLARALEGLDPGGALTVPTGLRKVLLPTNWGLPRRETLAPPADRKGYTPEEALRYVHPVTVERMRVLKYRPAALRKLFSILRKMAKAET